MNCETHPDTELICPACAGEKGGYARATKLTWDQRREIARLGGLASKGKRKRSRQADVSCHESNLVLDLPKPVRRRPIEDEW
jgi:hypothetical protein